VFSCKIINYFLDIISWVYKKFFAVPLTKIHIYHYEGRDVRPQGGK